MKIINCNKKTGVKSQRGEVEGKISTRQMEADGSIPLKVYGTYLVTESLKKQRCGLKSLAQYGLAAADSRRHDCDDNVRERRYNVVSEARRVYLTKNPSVNSLVVRFALDILSNAIVPLATMLLTSK
ncbi:hypothetical protein EVAR_49668_1 [Eumeta japonica]|uniref:Uncharacterized protein n=1 Tax=Eumeta variegata TaxID=151549 RepID=A0A4C1WQB2_EUMVA|nr:hypothetical protein EVAR_49668_1 [Eumeta japonica]